MSPPDEFVLFGPMFAIMLLAIVAYQFARRRTAQSCLAIAATVALFLLFTYGIDRQGFGAPVIRLIGSRYEAPSLGGLKVILGVGPVPYEERDNDLPYLRGFVEVKLPIRLDGLPSDARIQGPNVAVVIAANGIRYAGPWQNASVSEDTIGFPLPKRIFDQFAGVDTALHLEFVAERITPTYVRRVSAADHFPGPMNGSCLLISGKVVCRIVSRTSKPTLVQAQPSCNGQSSTMVKATLQPMKTEGTPDPVVTLSLALQRVVCTGESLTFTEYGSPQRVRLVLDVSGVRLEDYRTRE